jgi:hypothetical protein
MSPLPGRTGRRVRRATGHGLVGGDRRQLGRYLPEPSIAYRQPVDQEGRY